jgi:putative membrane protein
MLVFIFAEYYMSSPHWNDWYFSWGWFLWFGVIFLLFSSVGDWGYTYSAHRRYSRLPGKDALDILKTRYARGEITREQLSLMKTEIAKP